MSLLTNKWFFFHIFIRIVPQWMVKFHYSPPTTFLLPHCHTWLVSCNARHFDAYIYHLIWSLQCTQLVMSLIENYMGAFAYFNKNSTAYGVYILLLSHPTPFPLLHCQTWLVFWNAHHIDSSIAIISSGQWNVQDTCDTDNQMKYFLADVCIRMY
jgi:hypothetical protein